MFCVTYAWLNTALKRHSLMSECKVGIFLTLITDVNVTTRPVAREHLSLWSITRPVAREHLSLWSITRTVARKHLSL